MTMLMEKPKPINHRATYISSYIDDTHIPIGIGRDFRTVLERNILALSHYHYPVSRLHLNTTAEQIELLFRSLVDTWKNETRYSSSITEMVEHEAYKTIITLGPIVIPLLLEELKNEPNQWFWALHQITGEDPVDSEDYGLIDRMVEAWLKWGRERGYKC
jgi:hypothetical protein